MTLQNSVPPNWRSALICLALGFILIVACYWDTASAMVAIWERSGTFTHAFLVPPISLWLIWRLKSYLAVVAPAPTPWLALPLFVVGVIWILGEVAAVNVLTQFSLVSMVVLMVPMLLGMQVTRAITFPLLFLYFCVPFGEFVMPTLMQWTANITVIGVRMSGIPVYQEGLQFVIPSGNWSVVEACSGVRYLIASICVGVLFAYLNYSSLKRRLLFVLAAIIVPLIANWIRAYGIVMLGHVSGNKLATGVDHLVYGWVFFGLVITLLFMIGMRWQEAEVAPRFAPSSGQKEHQPSLAMVFLIFALSIALPRAAVWFIEKGNAHAAPVLNAGMLDTIPGWQLTPVVPTWKPAFVNPAAELELSFKQKDQVVGVYIGYYRQQDRTRKLISSENVLVKSEDPIWAQVSRDVGTTRVGSDELSVRTGLLRSGSLTVGKEQRLQVWQWYRVDGKNLTSDMQGKARTVMQKLKGSGDDGAVVMFYAPEGQALPADHVLEKFAADAYPAVIKLLEQVERQR